MDSDQKVVNKELSYQQRARVLISGGHRESRAPQPDRVKPRPHLCARAAESATNSTTPPDHNNMKARGREGEKGRGREGERGGGIGRERERERGRGGERGEERERGGGAERQWVELGTHRQVRRRGSPCRRTRGARCRCYPST